jgi:hypothetical protein
MLGHFSKWKGFERDCLIVRDFIMAYERGRDLLFLSSSLSYQGLSTAVVARQQQGMGHS